MCNAGELMLLAASLTAQAQEPKRGIAMETSPGLEQGYGRRHALVVGVDTYADPGYPDLGYAVADARAVAHTLVQDFGFAEADVRLILNEDATQDALQESLEEWACDSDRIGPEDLLVVFFAGHGVTRTAGKRKRGYLVPVDGKMDHRGQSSWSSLLGMNDLEDVSELIPAKHVLIVLDCCFGGLAVKRSAPPVAAGLSTRARQVITAGNADQPVLDTGGGGHSVFTGALLAAMGGAADMDADGVITFGELFNHVGREVERVTEARQTPLQATFPDHEGGSVALFAPGTRPGAMSAAERLRSLARNAEEQLSELKRLADYIVFQDLEAEAELLWPQEPSMVAAYRAWLERARGLLERLPAHQESVQRVRQEAYLSLVVAGEIDQGEGAEPDWERVPHELRWRHKTFDKLVQGLVELGNLVADVEQRLQIASTIRQRSIGDHREEWNEARIAIAEHPLYEGLELSPQMGLVPLGPDPYSGLWEFGHILSGERAVRDGSTGRLSLAEETGLVLVLVPGGSFLMGAQPANASWREANETPATLVDLDPYLLSKYEMTQAQWQRVTGANPSFYGLGRAWEWRFSVKGGDANLLHPVENISWNDCHRELFRLGLVLPTEAQWEYAARGGTETPWWSGSEISSLQDVANVADAFSKSSKDWNWEYEDELNDGFTVHAPIGSFLDNPMGFHDVHGNVWEWCQDYFSLYENTPRRGDGLRTKRDTPMRIARGGSFDFSAARARSAKRYGGQPDYKTSSIGVRPAAKLSSSDSDR